MLKITTRLTILFVLQSFVKSGFGAIYTYDDVSDATLHGNNLNPPVILAFGESGSYLPASPLCRPSLVKDHLDIGEDVELRRIFPNEFPQDTIRKSGSIQPEHLGRYAELKLYFREPRAKLNNHFEELLCYNENGKKLCRVDLDRYAQEEDEYFTSLDRVSHLDRRRVYCFMLMCFTDDELDRVVASF